MMSTTHKLVSYTYEYTPSGPRDEGSLTTGMIYDYDNSLGHTISKYDPTDMIQRLNLLLCGGALPESKLKVIYDLVSHIDVTTEMNQFKRASICLQLVTRSSEFYVSF